MAELSESQRKKIVRLGLLETFAEIVDSLYGSPMGASGSDHAPGQVPDPGATAGTSKYLREDGTWATPPNTEYNEATTSTAGLLSAADKTKLNGIEANADVTDAENVKLALSTNSNHGGEFLRKDGTWQVPTLSNSDVGLGNVLNKEQIPVEEKGVANGVATLDSMGKVPSTQLPSYVDDVIELLAITDTAPLTCVKDDKYYNTSSNKIFIATTVNTWDTTGETPEKEKIYVNTSNEKSYRWGGSAMIAVGSSDIEGIKVGSSGSLITPSQGVIIIPAYETGADVTDAENVKEALSVVQQSDGKYLKDDGTWDTPPNTEYESKAAASGGTEVSLVTTGEKYEWNSKTSNTGTVTSVVGGTGLDGGTISTSGTLSVKYGTTSGTACEGNDSRLSDARPASDVSAWAKASTKPTYKASEVMSISSQSISANTSSSCSITGSSNNGKAQTIIYVNNGSTDYTVTVPTTYKTPDGAAIELTCPAGGYCEVSYLNISGTIYARGL